MAGMISAKGAEAAAPEAAGQAAPPRRFTDPETLRQLETVQPGCCVLTLRQSPLGCHDQLQPFTQQKPLPAALGSLQRPEQFAPPGELSDRLLCYC